MELRIQGHSYRKIVEIMLQQEMVETYSLSTCYKDVKSSVRDLVLNYTETAEELLAMNVETLNRIKQAFLPYAVRDGDEGAANIVMRAIDQIAQLTGLHAYIAKKHHLDEITVNYQMKWPEQHNPIESEGGGQDAVNILQRALGYAGDSSSVPASQTN